MVSTTLPPAARESTLQDLLSLVAAGNEGALQGLHRMTGDRLHRVALRILGSWEAAEDAVADTFTQVWRRAGTFDSKRGNVNTWLNTIVRNRAIDRLRAGSIGAKSIDEMASAMHPEGLGGTPSQAAAGSEDASLLRCAIRHLPSLQREAIELAFFQGLSHAQVASTLDQPLGTVKTRIRAGIAAIREDLAG